MIAKLQSEVRRPAVAGAFYPRAAQELKSAVEAVLSQATKRERSGLCGSSVAFHSASPSAEPRYIATNFFIGFSPSKINAVPERTIAALTLRALLGIK